MRHKSAADWLTWDLAISAVQTQTDTEYKVITFNKWSNLFESQKNSGFYAEKRHAYQIHSFIHFTIHSISACCIPSCWSLHFTSHRIKSHVTCPLTCLASLWTIPYCHHHHHKYYTTSTAYPFTMNIPPQHLIIYSFSLWLYSTYLLHFSILYCLSFAFMSLSQLISTALSTPGFYHRFLGIN